MIEEESVIDGFSVGERNMTTGARSETKKTKLKQRKLANSAHPTLCRLETAQDNTPSKLSRWKTIEL